MKTAPLAPEDVIRLYSRGELGNRKSIAISDSGELSANCCRVVAEPETKVNMFAN
jgi:hypothetical protein